MRRFAGCVGYSEAELLRVGWADLTHPDDLKISLRMLEQLQRDPDGCAEAEKRYIHRSGAVVWVRMKISTVQDSAGSAYYVAHVEDITKRKRAEDALSESEDRFRVMADSCPTLMWVTNTEGGNQFINQAYREFCGTTLEQVEGAKWQLLIHPDDAPEYLGAFQRAVRDRANFRAEARVRRSDGEWRWLGSNAAPRFSSSGAFLGHIGLSSDFTDRRQAEEAFRFQNSLIHAIHEVTLDGILVINDENVIVSHNRKFLDVWRMPEIEIPDRLPDYAVDDQPPRVFPRSSGA